MTFVKPLFAVTISLSLLLATTLFAMQENSKNIQALPAQAQQEHIKKEVALKRSAARPMAKAQARKQAAAHQAAAGAQQPVPAIRQQTIKQAAEKQAHELALSPREELLALQLARQEEEDFSY